MPGSESSGRAERAATNEAMFRAVNEQLVHLEGALAEFSGVFVFVCECARLSCTQQLELTSGEYERVRQHADRFIIEPGHAQSADRLLETHDRYQVVEKPDSDVARAATR